MSRNLTVLGVFALALPIAVEAPHDTSGHMTRVSVGGGVGMYAVILRDCEGNPIGSQPASFREVGADIDQQVVGPMHVGIRGGTVREEIELSPGAAIVRTGHYTNPYVSIEAGEVGFGLGPVYSRQSLPRHAPGFSGHLRLGERTRYFSTSLMENVPVCSGGGYFDLGMGFHPHPRFDWWIGVSSGPFEGAGATIKTAWQASPRWTLDVSGRLGASGGEPQNGAAIGISSRFGQSSGKAPDSDAATSPARVRRQQGAP